MIGLLPHELLMNSMLHRAHLFLFYFLDVCVILGFLYILNSKLDLENAGFTGNFLSMREFPGHFALAAAAAKQNWSRRLLNLFFKIARHRGSGGSP